MISAEKYSYRVFWLEEDQAFIGAVAEFPSLSFVADTQSDALDGILAVVKDALEILREEKRELPLPFGMRSYSGKLVLRIPPEQHRRIAIEAAEEGVSINRLIGARI